MPRQKVQRDCEHCGGPMPPHAPSRSRFCSRPCVGAHVMKQREAARTPRICEGCGREFMSIRRDHRFCTKNCSRRAVYARGLQQSGECEFCGALVQRGGGNNKIRRYCSDECSARHRRAKAKARGEGSSHRKGWDGYGVVLLNDPCAYCGHRSETLDHIVPQARGGATNLGNLTGACHGCNQKKRTRSLIAFVMSQTIERQFPGWTKSADALP